MTSLATLSQGALRPLHHSRHRVPGPAQSQVTSHRTPSFSAQPSALAVSPGAPHTLLRRPSFKTSEPHSLVSRYTTRAPASTSAAWGHSRGVVPGRRHPAHAVTNPGGPHAAATEHDKKAPAGAGGRHPSPDPLFLLASAPWALGEETEALLSPEAAADAAIDNLPTWFGEFVVVLPLLAYALFFVIRARVSRISGTE